ncbi:MAG: hypothetical protein H7844_09580 [Nitrospirae bacterium YQR-1]
MQRSSSLIDNIGDIGTENSKLTVFLCLFPVIICYIYIWYFGVNTPCWDEWTEFYRIDLFLTGKHTFSGLFEQHNEHRTVTQRVTMILLAILTSYNTKIEMAFNQIAMVLTVWILFVEFKRLFGPKFSLVFFVPVPYLAFSLRQYDNILYAIQSVAYYPVFFGVLTFYFISRISNFETTIRKSLRFFFANAAAFTASFSFSSGLLVWPAGFFQILISGMQKKTKFFLLFIWLVTGFATFWLYFYDYRKPFYQHPVADSLLKYPLYTFKYIFYLTGNTLYSGLFINLITGVFIVFAAFLLFPAIFRSDFQKYSFWSGTLFYSFATIFLIAVGRTALDFNYILPKRYSTYGIVGPISLYVMYLGVISLESHRISKKYAYILKVVFGVFLLLLCSSIVSSFEEGYIGGQYIRYEREKIAYYVYTYKTQPDENLMRVFPGPDIVRQYAPILEKRKYSVFSRPYLPPLNELTGLSASTIGFCTLNGVLVTDNNQLFTIDDKHQYIKIDGWAVDNIEKDIAGGVYIKIDDKLFPAFYGISRTDVAEHFMMHKYRYIGFEVNIPVSLIEKGVHKLSVIVLTKNRKHYFIPNTEITVNRV